MNFPLASKQNLSTQFRKMGIDSFQKAAEYVQQLPYRRNSDKARLETVLDEQCGTCSSKHALLKQLAFENAQEGIALTLGIFKMNAVNYPETANTLAEYGLDYIPEAHCYLRVDGKILDKTKSGSKAADFENDLLVEIEIQPDQIGTFKVAYHQAFLKRWKEENPSIPFSYGQLWEIREQCIRDLELNAIEFKQS